MTEVNATGKQERIKNKRKGEACQPLAFSEMELKAELLREARVLGVPAGAAKEIAIRVSRQVSSWVEKRPAVTVADIDRRVALEMEKYSPDLAYVYQNRGKII